MIPEKVAYLINLDRRPDRWNEFVEKSSMLDIPILRFSAVEGLDLLENELRLPPPVAACWISHQEVAREFLRSKAEHCLVLEDDVDLDQDTISRLENLWEKNLVDIDLLQIGFCVHHNRLANRILYSIQYCIVNFLNRLRLLNLLVFRRILKSFYGYEFQRISCLAQPVAVMTFELGTHAYVMSRNFANTVVSFNNPVYLPADLAMIELVKTNDFRAFRLNKSLVSQNDSPSAISNASSNTLEKEITLISQARKS